MPNDVRRVNILETFASDEPENYDQEVIQDADPQLEDACVYALLPWSEYERLRAVVDAAVRVIEWAAVTWVSDYWPEKFVALDAVIRTLDGEPNTENDIRQRA